MDKIYKVKKTQLTYSEYITFLTKTTALSTDDEGNIMKGLRNIIFKVMFARTYLDIELPDEDTLAYDIVCNINYEDYFDKIAWNQFLDLQKSFDEYCIEVDKYVNKDINDAIADLIMSLDDVVNGMSDNLKRIDINDTLKMMTEFKDAMGQINTEKVMEFFLNKAIQENSDTENLLETDLNDEKELN